MTLSTGRVTPPRRHLLAIMQAALAAVDPHAAVTRAMRRVGKRLIVGGRHYDLDSYENVWVIGAGKAGAPMAQAAEEVLGKWLAGGIVVVKYDHRLPLRRIQLHEAAHPVPDAAALAAGRDILNLAERATESDLLICLLSGGGSALLEALPVPLSLEDWQGATEALLASGASINEVNTLRKHLSELKGGQLARRAAPATLITLALSDVVGSPLDVIASGPTAPDDSSWQDVERIVGRYGLWPHLPRRVRERIEQGVAGRLEDTPKADDPIFERVQTLVVGDNALAATAARTAARELGYHSMILTTFLEGEAREVGRFLVSLGRETRAHGRPARAPACLILGGETTVTLQAGTAEGVIPAGVGKGGRNQEVALAAALALQGLPGITIGALATDGTDGPTDSAGALADSDTVALAQASGLDAVGFLDRHDAYPLLDATGDLLRSGPTHTNVNDLLFVLVGLPGAATQAG